MRTQVGIIGSGPAGLLLCHLLRRRGIDGIVLERRSREYVLGRVRAGVLEQSSAAILRAAGVGARMDREGLVHDGFAIAFEERLHRIDLRSLAGGSVLIYGQTELTKDLVDAHDAAADTLLYEVDDVAISGIDGNRPTLHFTHAGRPREIVCDFIAGCDGYHGVSRTAIPTDKLHLHERTYPVGWLGVLADTPPVSEELVYVHHERGFALCSMRSRTRSRYYVQCRADENLAAWTDDRFWGELAGRLPRAIAGRLQIGPSIEKSIAPLRSLVAEPMRHGRLFLAGDAAHIVPPTGAKGLNLAVSDVHYLSEALAEHYAQGRNRALDAYSASCLKRVWKAERFSWWMTSLLHDLPGRTSFERRLERAELEYLIDSEAARKCLAENYVGLPL
jgi:p-hydroxybenzoate 3-monooxygenase